MKKGHKPISGSTEERFWAQVDTTGDCWLWLGMQFEDGYGAFYRDGQSRRAHRESYLMTHGSIPPEHLVCHTCDTPLCVRPLHLWSGTPAQNMDDMVSKGRSLVGERNHAARLTPDDVRAIRGLYQPGVITMAKVGERFGIPKQTVNAVVHRHVWAHID